MQRRRHLCRQSSQHEQLEEDLLDVDVPLGRRFQTAAARASLGQLQQFPGLDGPHGADRAPTQLALVADDDHRDVRLASRPAPTTARRRTVGRLRVEDLLLQALHFLETVAVVDTVDQYEEVA